MNRIGFPLLPFFILLATLISLLAVSTLGRSSEPLYIPRTNIYDGVHIRDGRDNLSGIAAVRHVRPRPYRGYPYGQPNPCAACEMAHFTGEYRYGRGVDVENSTPPMDYRTINRARPHARFW